MRRVLIAVGIALFLVVLVSATAHARPNEWHTIAWHTVRPGQTLSSIGRIYGVSPWAIASHNGILNPDRIYAWQVLAIPNAYGWGYRWPHYPHYPYHCGCRHYHTVAHGQNLYRISLQYGVNMWHLARCNHIYNVNRIWAGQTLCIP
jgi:LysM repeat protein